MAIGHWLAGTVGKQHTHRHRRGRATENTRVSLSLEKEVPCFLIGLVAIKQIEIKNRLDKHFNVAFRATFRRP